MVQELTVYQFQCRGTGVPHITYCRTMQLNSNTIFPKIDSIRVHRLRVQSYKTPPTIHNTYTHPSSKSRVAIHASKQPKVDQRFQQPPLWGMINLLMQSGLTELRKILLTRLPYIYLYTHTHTHTHTHPGRARWKRYTSKGIGKGLGSSSPSSLEDKQGVEMKVPTF